MVKATLLGKCASYSRLILLRLKASYSEIFLDCSLEMRSLDVHEIQDFWAQDSLVFAALNVRDRFRDDCVNRFLFAFDVSHCRQYSSIPEDCWASAIPRNWSPSHPGLAFN